MLGRELLGAGLHRRQHGSSTEIALDAVYVEMNQRAYLLLGAAGGVGAATARVLADRGARLVLAGRTAESLERLAGETGGIAMQLDATDTGQVAQAVQMTVSDFGRIDGVANCVGSLLLKPAHITTDEEWDETIAVNLRSAFAAVRAATKAMRSTGGSIVLVSSAAARVGLANHEAIAAAKAGIEGLTRAAAASYASDQIRVNAVAPGLVRTPLTQRLTASESAEDASIAMHALGRLGDPKEIAAAIAFLLDPANDWITGQVLAVDGGLASVRPRR